MRKNISSWELTDDFLFPRWDMLVPWRVNWTTQLWMSGGFFPNNCDIRSSWNSWAKLLSMGFVKVQTPLLFACLLHEWTGKVRWKYHLDLDYLFDSSLI